MHLTYTNIEVRAILISSKPIWRQKGGELIMSENKELKRGNGEQPETEKQGEDVEGYAYCDSHKQRCLNDCGGGGNATSFLSDLN